MSEYLSKKAVLEFIKARKAKFAGSYKDIEYGAYMELETIEAYIESGAFDADDSKAQRLRAALEKARQYVVNGYELGYIDDREGYTEALVREIDKALSTTEPTGQKGADDLIGDRIDEKCPKCGADLLANKIGDKWCSMVGCDYSINAPEGDGNG